MAETFATSEANYKAPGMADTWGHLAPSRDRKYQGRIVYSVDCFNLNPTPIYCRFDDIDSSPLFYDSLVEMLSQYANVEGCVYEWLGYFLNYKWVGVRRVVFLAVEEPL